MARCWIGTSGWNYPHWRGRFYPADLSTSHWLGFYAQRFSTVEINSTFYRLPKPETFEGWQRQAPAGFVYAVKASRFITHIKRLLAPETTVGRFIEHARHLGPTLGPILYQLPPRWRCNLERLDAFIAVLSTNLVQVFEFRDPSWLVDPVFERLAAHNLGFCIMSLPGFDCPVCATASVVYIRMHGSQVLYGDKYSRAELRTWAEHITRFLGEGRDVYVYFNNDAWAYAVENAMELREMVGA
jgi:uncharacterized protein YecE (DUF72 family)